MQKIKHLLSAIAMMAITLGSVTPSMASSVIDDVVIRVKLVVGLATFVPWAMRDKKGDLIGFEIDVSNQLAKDMCVDVELVPTAWDGIIPALLAKKYDAIVASMSITAEREKKVSFTCFPIT